MSFGCANAGVGNSWSSYSVPSLSDCEDNPQKPDGCTFENEFSQDESSWVTSMYNLAQVFSLPFFVSIMAFVGRRAAIVATAISFMAGWTFLTLAEPLTLDETYWFYIGRFLSGWLF